MPPCLALVFLVGLPVCIMASDSGQKLALSTEAEPWMTMTLERDAVPSIQLQLQEEKRSKNSQFFGLMGKRVKGNPELAKKKKKKERKEKKEGKKSKTK
ncbi:tachykinin-4 [Perognathus longimembris pacificus]|uniref:tachykinin-4 n=1 Tax=Perognathus longimembris pacificus TaxID=214514 RepID=UPI0020193B74|nr:tachykinin-4 [Perognathus longimembris pacificus]